MFALTIITSKHHTTSSLHNYKGPSGPFIVEGKEMPPEVIVGILSLAGTLIGSVAGIIASNKLTLYRIDQLEKKVDKHNNLIERTYALEEKQAVLSEQVKVANHRIDDLEKGDDRK